MTHHTTGQVAIATPKNMAKAVKIDIITRESIKPSSPTPEHLKHMKLSLLDQMSFARATPHLQFYTLKGNNRNINVSQQLKSSLSKVLTLFYPLAGAVVENSFIECNDDQGIEYIETQVDCLMSDIFENPNHDVLEKLIPADLHSSVEFTGTIVQVNFFACGGLAIGLCMSHKISDGASIGTFFMSWAASSLADVLSKEIPPELIPHFVSDTVIPAPKEFSFLPPQPPLMITDTSKRQMRRYIFGASDVALLKAKATSARVQQPTRVEAVTAFIWKCLMTMSRTKLGRARPSVLVSAVNLRARLVPPLPQNYVGNLSGRLLVKTVDDHIELQDLVGYLRKGLEELSEQVAKGIDISEMFEFAKQFGSMHGDDIDMYNLSSLCRFPFYEADFGWGKPAWVTVTNMLIKNLVVLLDTSDGKGVEVSLCLSEEDMALLEKNEELHGFASTNQIVFS